MLLPTRLLLALLVNCSLALTMPDAGAANPRTFVASTGSDANSCSLALPCRSFNVAIGKTNPGGEVVALDSAGYGTVTISGAITLAGPPGVQASITASVGRAVTVGAGASDRVVLRGLDISTTGTATDGIEVLSAGEVVIEDCDISGVADYGIGFVGPGQLTVSRTRVSASFNNIALGVFGSSGPARFVLEDSRLQVSGNGGGHAILAVDMVTGIIRNSALLGTQSLGTYGVRVQGSAGKPVSIAVQKSLVASHAYGIYADGNSVSFGASVSLADSDISQNEFALQATSGGTIAVAASQVTHNSFGATADATSFIFTDGRNFFGYNVSDLNGTTTLFGPIGIR